MTDTVKKPSPAVKRDNAAKSDEPFEGERIAKRIARAGLCSRRTAESWIGEGRVMVDGTVIASPALNVTDDNVITVDGSPLPMNEAPRLFRFHKPNGVLTAASDPQGRKTLTDVLPPGLPRVMPVGRLDMTSEGLLLLTTDGELKRHLELPGTGWIRRYRVRAYGKADPGALSNLTKGITVEGVHYGPLEVKLDRQEGANAWLTVSLREGKNREVRRVLEAIGLTVNRLIRTAYGPFQLGNLPKGGIDEVPGKVVREQLGGIVGGKPSDKKPSDKKKR